MLVLVLWVVALLTVVMYGALFATRTEYSLVQQFEGEVRARHAGLSGIEWAIAEIMNDPRPFVAPDAEWLRKHRVGDIEIEIFDEASKINFNVTSWEYTKGLVTESAARQLEELRPFETIHQLIRAKDMTRVLLNDALPFSTCVTWDRNTSLDGRPRVNLNTASAEELSELFSEAQIARIEGYRQYGKFGSACDLLNLMPKEELRRVIDRVTVYEEALLYGRLNVNTAPPRIFESFGVPPELIEKLVARRGQGDVDTIAWLMDVDLDAFRVCSNYVTTRSWQFRVVVNKRFEAIVEVDKGTRRAKILYFRCR